MFEYIVELIKFPTTRYFTQLTTFRKTCPIPCVVHELSIIVTDYNSDANWESEVSLRSVQVESNDLNISK